MSNNGKKNVASCTKAGADTRRKDDRIETMHIVTARQFASFVNGMTRAAIVAMGPLLVRRLIAVDPVMATAKAASDVEKDSGKPTATATDSDIWSGDDDVVCFISFVVAAYSLGRWIGSWSCTSKNHHTGRGRRSRLAEPSKLRVYASRLGGAAMSLQLFTYVYCYNGLTTTFTSSSDSPIRWLGVIRFLSGLLSGALYGLTSAAIPDDPQSPVDDGTIKVYLVGFAVSVLSGGFLCDRIFMPVSKNGSPSFPEAGLLSGTSYHYYNDSSHPWVGPFILLVGVAVSCEVVLRRLLFARGRATSLHKEKGGESWTGRPRLLSSSSHHRQLEDVDIEQAFQVGEIIGDGRNNISCEIDDPLRLSPHDMTLFGSPASKPFRGNSYDFMSPGGRSRMESHTSIDEFFDCRSNLSEAEFDDLSLGSDRGDTGTTKFRLERSAKVAQYTNHRCVYEDGSPAYVPQGSCSAEVPTCYLDFCRGNRERAQEAWEATQRWRFEKRVWRIHTLPNPWFAKIKEAYPHFVHGHSKAGYPIIYEQPGNMNLKELFRNGCEIADMVGHYTFFMEFVSNCICTRPEIRSTHHASDSGIIESHSPSSWGIMVVMDVKGAGLSHLSGDVLKYLKQAGDINSNHYPNSMKRAFLVNSPFWLAGAWSGIKGILPASVQVDILSETKYSDALRQHIDDDQIPPEYGGSSPYSLGDHPYEAELRQLVEKASNNSDDEQDVYNHLSEGLPSLIVSGPSGSESLDEFDVDDERFPLVVGGESSGRHSESSSAAPLRRRAGSGDHHQKNGVDLSKYRQHKLARSSEMNVLAAVSIMYASICAVQGVLELSIPLWLLSPVLIGGLGYSPSRSGVLMFCAALVLLWTMRKKHARLVSRLPSTTPVRAFRIGVGGQSMLLVILITASSVTPYVQRVLSDLPCRLSFRSGLMLDFFTTFCHTQAH